MIKRQLMLILALLVFSTFFFSCWSGSGAGLLSDVIGEASDDEDDDDRTVTVIDDGDEVDFGDCDQDNGIDLFDIFSTSDNEPDTVVRKSRWNWIGFSTGSGVVSSSDLYSFNHFNFYLNSRNRLKNYFSIGLGISPIQKTSYLSNSLSDAVMLYNIGVGHRIYTTPRHTLLGHYIVFGANYNIMAWDYKNAVSIERYDEDGTLVSSDEIKSDALEGIEIYFGSGLNLLQTKKVIVGGTITPGAIFWYWNTLQGFENDVFKPFYYVKFGINIQLNPS
ncbi:MAG: hypothetical protein PHW79_02580 [Candidatus Marinimicrobia bacterium]|jgi:hypothetical protein|nr:hypothetical protein [Candidatus Neomarinimicrobiota bacterium]